MQPPRSSRGLLGLTALLGVALVGALCWRGQPKQRTEGAPDPGQVTRTSNPSTHPTVSVAARSTSQLKLDQQANIAPDHLTAKEQKEAVVKQWGEFLKTEKTRLGAETFDPLAKHWLERARVRTLIEEWKTLEQAWPERTEQERAEQLPRIQAMWQEAMEEFAAELTAAGHPTILPTPR
jgi:hypothetical protein